MELDRSAFYPLGEGQPSNKDRFRWDGKEATIKIVRKKHWVRHILTDDSPLPEEGVSVEATLDRERRWSSSIPSAWGPILQVPVATGSTPAFLSSSVMSACRVIRHALVTTCPLFQAG